MNAMAALRSRRLESLFGVPVDQLAAEHIQSLVTNQVTEEFDLDFKQELYGRSDSAKRDLAGDVAALANTAGGVVVVGVAEDEQARATGAEGVDLSDTEKARMLQVVAAGVSPMPLLDIIPVPLEEPTDGAEGSSDEGQDDTRDATVTGYYVIAVPRSPSAPHAVLVNDGFRYPKRNGATTRYLSEPEVAAAYRDRLAGVEAQTRRIDDVERDASQRLQRDKLPWVMVSLVPDLPGDLDITWAVQRKFQDQTIHRHAYDILGSGFGVSFQRTMVGRRRLIADGGYEEVTAKDVSAEYHWDGAGAYSLDLWDLRSQTRSDFPDAAPLNQLVADEAVVLSVLTGLRRLADHARDWAAAGGNALVRAQLLPASDVDYGLEIGHTRGFGGGESRSRVALTEHIGAAETVASLDELARPGPALVAVAARLSDELGQVFGIPEMGQFTREGEIRIRYWSRNSQPMLRAWAEDHGVTVSEKVLED